jgi:hypothetical protein
MAALAAPPSLGRKRPRKADNATRSRFAAVHNVDGRSFVNKETLHTAPSRRRWTTKGTLGSKRSLAETAGLGPRNVRTPPSRRGVSFRGAYRISPSSRERRTCPAQWRLAAASHAAPARVGTGSGSAPATARPNVAAPHAAPPLQGRCRLAGPACLAKSLANPGWGRSACASLQSGAHGRAGQSAGSGSPGHGRCVGPDHAR